MFTNHTLLIDVSNNKLADKSKKGPVMSVTLMKEGGGLGFSLEGGKDSPSGDLPLTIKKIFTGKLKMLHHFIYLSKLNQ